MCDLCLIHFIPATAKKEKLQSSEFLLDRERFSLASIETLERWNIDHLQMLNIIGKKLTVEQSKILVRVLKNYGDTLRKVHLVDVKFSGKIGLGHCSSLLLALNLEPTWMRSNTVINSLKHCRNLHSLKINSTIVAGTQFLSDALKHLKNLQILSLKSNHIASDGALAIGNSLKYCTNLQTLDLEDIGSEGSISLAVSCQNLHTLNLAANGIGNDGARALTDGLKHCFDLQTLNLGWNSIGADGAKAIADGLVYCSNLQTLNLGWNEISNDGVKYLVDGLKYCSDLQTLNLGWNEISDGGAKALADGLKYCPDLYKHSILGGTNLVMLVQRPLLMVSSTASTCRQ